MKQKIVIIESDRLIADVLADRLSREEYVVYSAKDRVRGERLVREKLPSLVLLDVSKQSEMEFLQDFSDDAVLRRIPVIAILDFGKKEKIKKVTALGAVDWMTKLEFDPTVLVEKIKKQLNV
ncbi:response regulator [Patescibacteria group bacterium]|nr:response regulator [Patescibacteria group bacterium]